MAKSKILVIEDNADTRNFLFSALKSDFEVLLAENAIVGIEFARTKKPDLILLDIMMPMVNGFEACGMLKKDPQTKSIPIIFVSAKNTVKDITHGLSLGADDYVSKPFDYKELIARIKVRLREKASWQSEPKKILAGDLCLVLDTREALLHNQHIDLTETEFDLLRVLVQKSPQILSRDEIVQEIWKSEKTHSQKRTIDVHIRALRKKAPTLQRHLMSIYGKGYKYER